VHVVAASPGQAATYQDGAATIHRIPYPQSAIPGYEESTGWMLYSVSVAEKLARLNAEHLFDIFQFPEYGGEGFIYQTDTFHNRTAKYVVQMHGPLSMFVEHMGWPDRGSTFHTVGAFMERTVLHHADKLLASSQNTANFCQEVYGIDASQVEVIHSALDVNRFRVVPPEPAPGLKLLFVGNIVGNKGADLLIRSILELKETLPEIRLRMIGKGDGAFIKALRRKAESAGASEMVEILGYVPYSELPAHYAWSDVFVGPSHFEPGPGNIYLEAMACGRPVVACNSGGTPEVVLDGETGLLVMPQDVGALAGAIRQLAADVPLRTRLGLNARKWIESRFTLDRYIDRVESIYQGLIDMKPADVSQAERA
jgi:glycosyltransferase involved in cell wall biosynthesis